MSTNYQQKTLSANDTSVDFVSDPGQIEVSGDFSGGTVTWVNTGGTTTLGPGLTANDTFETKAQRLTFGITGAATPDVNIKWWPNVTPY